MLMDLLHRAPAEPTLRDRLVAAKAEIDEPRKWVQGTFVAHSADGTKRQCMAHAVAAAYSEPNAFHLNFEHEAYRALAAAIPPAERKRYPGGREVPLDNVTRVCHYNNSHTHDQVMEVFDAAISAA